MQANLSELNEIASNWYEAAESDPDLLSGLLLSEDNIERKQILLQLTLAMAVKARSRQAIATLQSAVAELPRPPAPPSVSTLSLTSPTDVKSVFSPESAPKVNSNTVRTLYAIVWRNHYEDFSEALAENTVEQKWQVYTRLAQQFKSHTNPGIRALCKLITESPELLSTPDDAHSFTTAVQTHSEALAIFEEFKRLRAQKIVALRAAAIDRKPQTPKRPPSLATAMAATHAGSLSSPIAKPRDEASLLTLLHQIHDAKSPYYRSMHWLNSDEIAETLQQHLGNTGRAHLIHPSANAIFNPFNPVHGQAAAHFINEIIKGRPDEELGYAANGSILAEAAGCLDKPIVMVLNTAGEPLSAAESAALDAINKGSHWVLMVIFPANYHPPYGIPLRNAHERIYLIDSLQISHMPASLIDALRLGSEQMIVPESLSIEEIAKGHKAAVHSIIEAPFPDLEIGKVPANFRQQEGYCDCGVWAAYNALMMVLTGPDYLAEFKTPQSAGTLRGALFGSAPTVFASRPKPPPLPGPPLTPGKPPRRPAPPPPTELRSPSAVASMVSPTQAKPKTPPGRPMVAMLPIASASATTTDPIARPRTPPGLPDYIKTIDPADIHYGEVSLPRPVTAASAAIPPHLRGRENTAVATYLNSPSRHHLSAQTTVATTSTGSNAQENPCSAPQTASLAGVPTAELYAMMARVKARVEAVRAKQQANTNHAP